MKVSLNTVKQYIDVELPPVDELVVRINQQLGGVEEVIDLGAKYRDAKIVRVVECEKHANADKLSVCMVDAGQADLVQIVCGASNVHADMWAVWLPPESTVPSTCDDAEPFVLAARELRGVMSYGMLASARELALGDDHDGIVEIADGDLPDGQGPLEPGQSFAKVFGLDDTIIDIENKMFTHRPDLFGQLGVAREIYAILRPDSDDDEHTDHYMIPSDWYWTRDSFEGANGLPLEVFNNALEQAPRFMAVAMKDVAVKSSPLWLQAELVRWGGKPINNVVDLTNYIMLLTAQPTHAYDYDKLRGEKLGVRMADSGEKVTLLNGKTYELTTGDIVIADGEGAVGLAGIMGSGAAEVSAKTKNIVLEVATFDMYAVRRSSMRHGLFTDALARFNKGQSKLQNDRVIAKLMALMAQYAGAAQASDVFDVNDFSENTDTGSLYGEQTVKVSFINERLGLDLSGLAIGNILRAANFAVFKPGDDDDELSVTAPFWRTDIELPEDIVEEVGRLYGFDKLPRELPSRSTRPAAKNPAIVAKQHVRSSLAKAGANEVLTYSFVHRQTLEKAAQDPEQAFRLSNALSPDLQYYRLSLTPSLLEKVHSNIKAGHDEFALFEIGKSHAIHHVDDGGLPEQFDRIALVYASRKASTGSAYYTAQKLVRSLFADNHVTEQLAYRRLVDVKLPSHSSLEQMLAPFEPERSAMVYVGDKFVGVVGEYKLDVARNFKLPQSVAGFELFVSPFVGDHSPEYRPLSRFPSSHQDISLQVDATVSYAGLLDVVADSLTDKAHELRVNVEPLSIYQARDSDQKTITLRLTVNNPEMTLTDDTVDRLMEEIAVNAKRSLGAVRI